MTSLETRPRTSSAPAFESRIVLDGASWADYQRLLELRGERSVPRLTYLEGRLEIMSPSRPHENWKSRIGCLVEAWCLERGVEFSPYGSWTIENKQADRGAEPDECYVFGVVEEPEKPDLAIEVVWTSGGIDKLEVYRKLAVQEVWFWKEGRIQVFVLRAESYEEVEASEVLPEIDLAQLESFLDRPTASQSIREYQAALRA